RRRGGEEQRGRTHGEDLVKHGVPEGRVGEWEGLSGLRVHPPCRSAPPRRRRLRPRAATGGVSHPEDGLSIRNGQWSQPASAAGAPTVTTPEPSARTACVLVPDAPDAANRSRPFELSASDEAPVYGAPGTRKSAPVSRWIEPTKSRPPTSEIGR